MPSIFISYRREDTIGHAGRLFDSLSGKIGRENVFMDLAGIKPGEDFSKKIVSTLEKCDAVVPLIGNRWLNTADGAGRRRIDDVNYYFRMEILQALRSVSMVVPALVHGARMPRADDLPSDLRQIAALNAIELSDQRWAYDVRRLLNVINGDEFAELDDEQNKRQVHITKRLNELLDETKKLLEYINARSDFTVFPEISVTSIFSEKGAVDADRVAQLLVDAEESVEHMFGTSSIPFGDITKLRSQWLSELDNIIGESGLPVSSNTNPRIG